MVSVVCIGRCSDPELCANIGKIHGRDFEVIDEGKVPAALTSTFEFLPE